MRPPHFVPSKAEPPSRRTFAEPRSIQRRPASEPHHLQSTTRGGRGTEPSEARAGQRHPYAEDEAQLSLSLPNCIWQCPCMWKLRFLPVCVQRHACLAHGRRRSKASGYKWITKCNFVTRSGQEKSGGSPTSKAEPSSRRAFAEPRSIQRRPASEPHHLQSTTRGGRGTEPSEARSGQRHPCVEDEAQLSLSLPNCIWQCPCIWKLRFLQGSARVSQPDPCAEDEAELRATNALRSATS